MFADNILEEEQAGIRERFSFMDHCLVLHY